MLPSARALPSRPTERHIEARGSLIADHTQIFGVLVARQVRRRGGGSDAATTGWRINK